MTDSSQIQCPGCSQQSLLLREPIYDGFTKVGEVLRCGTCGHEFADEASVPFLGKSAPVVFTDADKSEAVQVFEDGEASRLCRYCAHYVVNPFMQRCSHHKKEVQATDSCADFAPIPDEPDEGAAPI